MNSNSPRRVFARTATGVLLLALGFALTACADQSPVAPAAAAVRDSGATLRTTEQGTSSGNTDEQSRKRSGYLVSGGRSEE